MKKVASFELHLANFLCMAGLLFYALYVRLAMTLPDFHVTPTSVIVWAPILGASAYYNFHRDSSEVKSTWLYFLFFFFFIGLRSSVEASPKLFGYWNVMTLGHGDKIMDFVSIIASVGFVIFLLKHIIWKSGRQR